MRSRHDLGLALLIAMMAGPVVLADPPEKDKASGALALAKAQREREKAHATVLANGCYTDRAAAAEAARKAGRKLYLFVGLTCESFPDLAVDLRKDGVLCHVDQAGGDSAPRISVIGRDRAEYYVPREKVAGDTAGKLRKAYDQSDPKPLRKDVGLSEEVRRKATAKAAETSRLDYLLGLTVTVTHADGRTERAGLREVLARPGAVELSSEWRTRNQVLDDDVALLAAHRGSRHYYRADVPPEISAVPFLMAPAPVSRSWGVRVGGPFGGGFAAGACTTSA